MSDKSIIPLGTGVTITDALQPQLGLLLDANQATYQIASGEGLHLLFIRADRFTFNEGWTFSLQSLPIEQVENIFKSIAQGGENRSPRWVDEISQQVAMDTEEESHYTPTTQQKQEALGLINISTYPYLVSSELGAIPVNLPLNLEYYEKVNYLNKIIEVGTHIYPIAYHRVIAGDPPRAYITQVARSDWHFWPAPNTPIWNVAPKLNALTFGGCG